MMNRKFESSMLLITFSTGLTSGGIVCAEDSVSKNQIENNSSSVSSNKGTSTARSEQQENKPVSANVPVGALVAVLCGIVLAVAVSTFAIRYYREQQLAATRIQRAWRAYQIQRAWRATRIQQAWRVYQAQKKTALLLNAKKTFLEALRTERIETLKKLLQDELNKKNDALQNILKEELKKQKIGSSSALKGIISQEGKIGEIIDAAKEQQLLTTIMNETKENKAVFEGEKEVENRLVKKYYDNNIKAKENAAGNNGNAVKQKWLQLLFDAWRAAEEDIKKEIVNETKAKEIENALNEKLESILKEKLEDIAESNWSEEETIKNKKMELQQLENCSVNSRSTDASSYTQEQPEHNDRLISGISNFFYNNMLVDVNNYDDYYC